MYYSRYSSATSKSGCESDYFNFASSPMETNNNDNKSKARYSHNIFDTPDFVIDVYLDAINGGSTKDSGFRLLSDKYSTDSTEGNFNCNHNPKECCDSTDSQQLGGSCPQRDAYERGHNGHSVHHHPDIHHSSDPHHPHSADHQHHHHKSSHSSCHPPKDSSTCPCNSENPYEEGKSPFVEPLKSNSCGCHGGSPYEKGEHPTDEPPKEHFMCGGCHGPRYEDGANPFKDAYKPPALESKKEPEKPKPIERDVAKLYPVDCNKPPFAQGPYTDDEGCAMCVSKFK